MDTSNPGDEFDFYPCLVDGAPASIYLNLRFEREAPAGADTRYLVTIQMLDAGPHGVGTAAEADDLNACEEALIARAAELGLVYAGRIRNRGTWEVTFYGPAGHVEVLRATAAQRVGDRHVDARSDADPDWRYYRELLLPDAERTRWMDDRRLVQILREQGDALTTPRRVDHWAYFTSAPARDAFVAAAARAGFALERVSHDHDRDHPFGAQVFRTDPIELDRIHDAVMTLVDAADAHGGAYDRWVTSIERGYVRTGVGPACRSDGVDARRARRAPRRRDRRDGGRRGRRGYRVDGGSACRVRFGGAF